jgi:hypothetical protein
MPVACSAAQMALHASDPCFARSRACTVCAACYSVLLVGCDLGFHFSPLFGASDASVSPPPPLCGQPPCCGKTSCAGACCFDGNILQCLGDAGECKGQLFQDTQCLTAADCCVGSSCACCLSGFWATQCEQDDILGPCMQSFGESQLCTSDTDCADPQSKCVPVFADSGPLISICVFTN